MLFDSFEREIYMSDTQDLVEILETFRATFEEQVCEMTTD